MTISHKKTFSSVISTLPMSTFLNIPNNFVSKNKYSVFLKKNHYINSSEMSSVNAVVVLSRFVIFIFSSSPNNSGY